MSNSLPLLIGLLLLFAGCRQNDANDIPVEDQAPVATGPLIKTVEGKWTRDSSAMQPEEWLHINALDTVVLEEYHLNFKPYHTTFQPYYKDHAVRDSLTDLYQDPYEQARAVERYLQGQMDNFRREGDTLWLLGNGTSRELHFKLWDKKYLKFCLENYDFGTQWFLIKVFFVHGSAYLVVNGKSGSSTYLWGRPYPSPDSTLVMTINNDQSIQYSANGLQLFKPQNDSLILQWSLGINNWGPVDMKWIGSDSLIIRREYPAPNESEEVYIRDEVLLHFTAIPSSL